MQQVTVFIILTVVVSEKTEFIDRRGFSTFACLRVFASVMFDFIFPFDIISFVCAKTVVLSVYTRLKTFLLSHTHHPLVEPSFLAIIIPQRITFIFKIQSTQMRQNNACRLIIYYFCCVPIRVPQCACVIFRTDDGKSQVACLLE